MELQLSAGVTASAPARVPALPVSAPGTVPGRSKRFRFPALDGIVPTKVSARSQEAPHVKPPERQGVGCLVSGKSGARLNSRDTAARCSSRTPSPIRRWPPAPPLAGIAGFTRLDSCITGVSLSEKESLSLWPQVH